MELFSIENEEALRAFAPIAKISGSDLDEISKTVYLKMSEDGLTFKASDGIVQVRSTLEDVESSEFEGGAFDLETIEHVLKKTKESLTLENSGRSYKLGLFQGSVDLNTFFFDEDTYDPFFTSTGREETLDRKSLKLIFDSSSSLKESSLSPEYSFIFMDGDCAWICNGYSVTKIEGDVANYSLPLDAISYLKQFEGEGDLDVTFGEETVKVEGEISEFYHEKSDVELSQDYKDVVSDDYSSVFSVDRSRMKKILSVFSSVPYSSGDVTLEFSDEDLSCSLRGKDGEESSLVLSEDSVSDSIDPTSVDTNLSHLKSVLKALDSPKIEIGLDQYCLSLSGEKIKSVIFIQ